MFSPLKDTSYLRQSLAAGVMMELTEKRLQAYADNPPTGVTVTLGRGAMHDCVTIEIDDSVDLDEVAAEMTERVFADLPKNLPRFTAEPLLPSEWP